MALLSATHSVPPHCVHPTLTLTLALTLTTYSFGVLLFEIMSRSLPYAGVDTFQVEIAALRRGRHLPGGHGRGHGRDHEDDGPTRAAGRLRVRAAAAGTTYYYLWLYLLLTTCYLLITARTRA
eukprot:scaffold93752_cov49-Phaeocystis_antarctica.AAC.2